MKFAKNTPNSIQIHLHAEHLSKTLSQDLQNMLLLIVMWIYGTHIPVLLHLDYAYATAELHLGIQWKIAPLDEVLSQTA